MNPKVPLPPANGIHTSTLTPTAPAGAQHAPAGAQHAPDPAAKAQTPTSELDNCIAFRMKSGAVEFLQGGTILYDRTEVSMNARGNAPVIPTVRAVSGHSPERNGRVALMTADIERVTINDEIASHNTRTCFAAFLSAFYGIPDSVPSVGGEE